jgi:hypothetical protein
MGMPIEQQAADAVKPGEEYFGTAEKSLSTEQKYNRDLPTSVKLPSLGAIKEEENFDISALVGAQATYIKALMDHLESPDVSMIAHAQAAFIRAQSMTLKQLGIL